MYCYRIKELCIKMVIETSSTSCRIFTVCANRLRAGGSFRLRAEVKFSPKRPDRLWNPPSLLFSG